MSDTIEIDRTCQRSDRKSSRREGKRARAPSSKAAATKNEKLEELLSRARGATLDQLQSELGWQPHTVRAAISRLRKAGYKIELTETKGRKAYRLAS